MCLLFFAIPFLIFMFLLSPVASITVAVIIIVFFVWAHIAKWKSPDGRQ